MDTVLVTKTLLLLIVAHGTPVLVRDLLGDRWNRPVDGGKTWHDGRPLFGRSKTIRGLLSATTTTAVAGYWIEFGWSVGAAFGLLAMTGDLLASFIKRRLGLPASAKATGLDQLPEAVLPLAVLAHPLGLGVAEIAAAAMLFFVLEVTLSPLLFKLGIRRRPY